VKVALYHPWIYVKSGLERTILEIARRSRHEWQIFTSHYDAGGTYPELREFNVRETGKVSVRRSYGAVLGASAQVALTRLDLDGADALVVCCDGVGSLITLRNARRPVVNLCFTPLRAVYDPEYRRRHLARRRPLARALALALEAGYRAVDKVLWRRYRRVVCISEAVRERVEAGGLGSAAPTVVLYPGIDAASIRASDRFEPFFFLPGRIMWTKNLELGIEAFHRFRAAGHGQYRLVVAGMVDAKSAAYFERLRGLAAPGAAVDFHVDPTDAQMQDYYRRCTAVLLTAFNEDLGLTPMEAMACGKPVVAVDRGGPREVVEPGVTGYLAEPDPAAFSEAMLALAGDAALARSMGRAGLERVRRFTWDRFVEGLDDVIDQVVEEERRREAGGGRLEAGGKGQEAEGGGRA